MVSVPARRQQVAYGRERGLSARRACTLFSVARSTLNYRSRKAAKDAPVVERMTELSAQYPRYGYRRIRIFLDRDGHAMSPGRAHRLWRTARLQVPRKRPRKRVAAAARPRPQAPSGPNQVWSYDFVFDHCANGQQLKCLTVTDEFTKEGLAIDVDGRIRSARVIEVLSRLVSERGAPRCPAQRQRAGVRVQRAAVLDRRTRYRHGIDRARQALAEWRRGELQRQVPRRVSEPRMVSFARRSEGTDRRMATPLQRGAPSFEPRLSHAQRVRDSRSKTSAPSCNGPGRCGMSGLRAPARCSTVPSGTNAASRGSRLKLTVVRRIRAGQPCPGDSFQLGQRLLGPQ